MSERAPLCHEVRVYVQGDFYYSRAFAAVEQAEAEERQRELIATGWAGWPATTEQTH